MNTSYIGSKVTALSLQKGKSLTTMGKKLGFTAEYLHQITSEKCLPTLNELFKICAYLKVTPEEFFNENENSPYFQHKALQVELNKLSEKEYNLVLEFIACLNENKSVEQQPKP